MAEVTVVVPARDAAATIGRTLAALAAQDVEVDYEVLVVDSGSRDETPEIASEAPIVTEVLRNPGGEPASSRNAGARRGTGTVLAFTDADCEPTHQWLSVGLRALERADIVQGRVLPGSAPAPFDRTVSVSSEYGLYETANLFVRRGTFERVGGFEPVLGIGADSDPFGEDAWFVWRARRSGARTAFATDALVYHEVFARGLTEFLAAHARTRYFPPLVALIPELREHFLRHHVFLTTDSAWFDLALTGMLASAVSRRRLPALAALSAYVAHVGARARRGPLRTRVQLAGGRIAADAVTFAALVRGSVTARSLVL